MVDTTNSSSDAAAERSETAGTAVMPEITVAPDYTTQEGHGETTIELWGLSELDLLLTQYSDATHTARDVSEDPMIGEIAASLVVCRTTASDRLGIPAQTATGFAPRPPKHGQAQVTPPRVA